MNATPHTVIGYSMIKLVGGNPLGCLLAFGSHLLADYIGESGGIKTTKQRIIFDVVLAALAHYNAGQDITLTLTAIVFAFVSYFLGKQVRPMYSVVLA